MRNVFFGINYDVLWRHSTHTHTNSQKLANMNLTRSSIARLICRATFYELNFLENVCFIWQPDPIHNVYQLNEMIHNKLTESRKKIACLTNFQ